MGRYLVGIDEGTSGCKTGIFDFDGNMVGTAFIPYPCYYPKPGWVEQKAEDMVPACYESCRQAIANSGIDAKEIVALAISSQGSVTGPVDKSGKLLRDFIGWQDLRGSEEEKQLESRISREDLYRISGHPMGLIFSITKYMWVLNNQPEIIDKTALWSTNQDYFNVAFGAEDRTIDLASAARINIFDVDAREYSKDICDAAGLDISMQPPVTREAGKVVGKVSKAVSEKSGLPEGTLICVGSMDQNCSTFGSGAVEDGVAALVLGTYGSCYVVSDKAIRDPKGSLVVKNNVGPDNFTIEGFSTTAACSYRWYRDTFCDLEVAASRVLNEDPYNLINTEIATSKPGANGVTFLSYLQGAQGARGNANARGVFSGMSLGTSKADMARAVMEGICYEMNEILVAELKAGIALNGIRLTGGAAKSPLWCQMFADISGQPIYALECFETGCLGAAMYAGVGAGVYKDCSEASKTAVRIARQYDPDKANFAAYQDGFKRFVDVYDALADNGIF